LYTYILLFDFEGFFFPQILKDIMT